MSVGWITALIAGLVALAAFGLYLSMTAGRLDHVHRRIDTSRLALGAHLLRRSSVCVELAASGALDPATAMLLADAAHAARTASDADDDARSRAESDLSAALRAAFDDPADAEDARSMPGAAALVDELAAACRRVELSRRFLNDAVRACRLLRRQRAVRWFRLAGRTALPEPWEMDDALPAALARAVDAPAGGSASRP